MPVIRLTSRLWDEYVHQVRANSARRATQARVRRRLIVLHMPMVARIADQVWRHMTHIPLDELVSDGYLGLVKAAGRYDPARGEFEHFAYFIVKGAMIDAHKRRAYKDETHDSIEEIQERLGFLPAHLATDTRPLPDELANIRKKHLMLIGVINRVLPDDERRVILLALAGVPLPEIANSCGRGVPWVRSKLGTARDAVARVVQGRAA